MATTKRRPKGYTAAEFAPALIIFLLVLLFPLINLIGLGMGYAVVYLTAKQCASSAGSSQTFNDALSSSETTARTIAANGFGQFAKVQPVGGFNGSGMDLYTVNTDLNTLVSNVQGPNTPYVGIVDADRNTYEYQTVVTYDVGPFLNLSSLPFVGGVPGVGSPARLSATAQSHVENLIGLNPGGGVNPNLGGGGPTFGRPNPGGGVPDSGGIGAMSPGGGTGGAATPGGGTAGTGGTGGVGGNTGGGVVAPGGGVASGGISTPPPVVDGSAVGPIVAPPGGGGGGGGVNANQ